MPAGLKPFEEAYQELLPRLRGLKPDEVLRVNVDVTSTVATVLGALPGMLEWIPRIRRELPLVDVEDLRKLGDYAKAVSHTHTIYLLALRRDDELRELVREGSALRATLVADAMTLIRRGVVSSTALKQLKKRAGFKNLASDLQILAGLFRTIGDKRREVMAPLPRDELERADAIASDILRLARPSKGGPASASAAAKMRARAFTLLHRSYDEARRAMTFLRWKEGDAGAIVPSLYAGRGGRKRTQETARTAPLASEGTASDGTSLTAASTAVNDKPAAVPEVVLQPQSIPRAPEGGPFMP
jgi:hypothetical protein